MKIKVEIICKAILRTQWSTEELALLKDAVKSHEDTGNSEVIKALKKFPYARIVKPVVPKSANGKMVVVLAIRRGMVTFKLYEGDGAVHHLSLHVFEPLTRPYRGGAQ